MKEHYFSGAPWEKQAAYSRAIKTGNIIEVAGTTAVKNGITQFPNDIQQQTQFIFAEIKKAIKHFDGTMQDVIRTRMYVTDISLSDEVMRVHKAVFTGINPVATMVEVNRLIDPELLIEIEVTAIINEE